jgi:hypothetical protein
VAALLLGVALLVLARGGGTARGRLIAAILAACWVWVAWAFHHRRYATINWAAVYFAAAFAVEALLLVWIGVVRARLVFRVLPNAIDRTCVGIVLFALFAQPLVGPLTGGSWSQIELFGLAPDPTAVATLGILLLANGQARWALLAIPLSWSAVSGTTLATMASPQAAVFLVAAPLALLLALARGKA